MTLPELGKFHPCVRGGIETLLKDSSSLRQLTATLGVTDRMRFWGDVPELNRPDLYNGFPHL